MTRPELVIFDCDGVLVDSEILAEHTLQAHLQAWLPDVDVAAETADQQVGVVVDADPVERLGDLLEVARPDRGGEWSEIVGDVGHSPFGPLLDRLPVGRA